MAIEVQDEQGSGKEKNTEDKVVQIKESDLAALLSLKDKVDAIEKSGVAAPAGTQDQLLSTLVERITGMNGPRTGQFEFDTQHSELDIDPEDILSEEEAVTFVAHKVAYVIVDDKRNGRNVKAPIDKIEFKYAHTKQVKNGKEVDLFNLCTYTCRSKKELEWLRSHSLFNVTFFDTVSTTLSEDVMKANKIAKHVIRLQSLGQQKLVNMAKGYGITVGSDFTLENLRAEIAIKSAEKEMESERANSERMLRESKLESDLVERSLS